VLARRGIAGFKVLDQGDAMNATKGIAIVLIVLGILALVFGGFNYTKETHEAKLGPIEFSVKDKERVNIPMWAGIAAIVIGGVLLVVKKP